MIAWEPFTILCMLACFLVHNEWEQELTHVLMDEWKEEYPWESIPVWVLARLLCVCIQFVFILLRCVCMCSSSWSKHPPTGRAQPKADSDCWGRRCSTQYSVAASGQILRFCRSHRQVVEKRDLVLCHRAVLITLWMHCWLIHCVWGQLIVNLLGDWETRISVKRSTKGERTLKIRKKQHQNQNQIQGEKKIDLRSEKNDIWNCQQSEAEKESKCMR